MRYRKFYNFYTAFGIWRFLKLKISVHPTRQPKKITCIFIRIEVKQFAALYNLIRLDLSCEACAKMKKKTIKNAAHPMHGKISTWQPRISRWYASAVRVFPQTFFGSVKTRAGELWVAHSVNGDFTRGYVHMRLAARCTAALGTRILD